VTQACWAIESGGMSADLQRQTGGNDPHCRNEVTGMKASTARQREVGPAGNTLWNLERLKSVTKRLAHSAVDIHDRPEELFGTQRFI